MRFYKDRDAQLAEHLNLWEGEGGAAGAVSLDYNLYLSKELSLLSKIEQLASQLFCQLEVTRKVIKEAAGVVVRGVPAAAAVAVVNTRRVKPRIVSRLAVGRDLWLL